MSLRGFHLILLVCICLRSGAQQLVLEAEIKGRFELMTTDNIGRLYLARGHELFLYTNEGRLLYQFSDLSRGMINSIDTRNPLKILLFYPGYGQINFLDNTLSPTRHEPIQLSQFGMELSQLACTSFDNGFWLYDPVSFRLVRYDQSLLVTNEVANINQLVGLDLNPIHMAESDSWVYMNDPEHGIFVFDSFGTYSKMLPFKGIRFFQLRDNSLFFGTADGFYRYDLQNFEESEIELPIKDPRAVRVEKERLYILTDQGVFVFGPPSK